MRRLYYTKDARPNGAEYLFTMRPTLSPNGLWAADIKDPLMRQVDLTEPAVYGLPPILPGQCLSLDVPEIAVVREEVAA